MYVIAPQSSEETAMKLQKYRENAKFAFIQLC